MESHEFRGEIILVPGHAICLEPARAREDSAWVLLPFQRGEQEYYLEHLEAGIRLAAERGATLVLSGGVTRREGEGRSEAGSYQAVAEALGWFGFPEVAARTLLDNSARDSYENLRFALALARSVQGTWPSRITVCGWEFKRERYSLHREAIGWPAARYHYLGVNNPRNLAVAEASEAATREAFRSDPHGEKADLSRKRAARNPFHHEVPNWALAPLDWPRS